MERVKEKTSAYLTVTFEDKDDAAAQPTSSTYQIDDVKTGSAIRISTALSPTAGVVEIHLDKTDNTIQDVTRKSERRRVTVNGVYGSDDEVHDQYIYEVVNLAEVS